MNNSFSIKSVKSDRELVFLSNEGEFFEVELRGHTLLARRRVWGFGDCAPLVELFEQAASVSPGNEASFKWAPLSIRNSRVRSLWNSLVSLATSELNRLSEPLNAFSKLDSMLFGSSIS